MKLHEAPTQEQFEIDGSRVRLITPAGEAGERPLLVLFNGIGADVDHWADFPEALDRPVAAINVAKTNKLGWFATMYMYEFAEAAVKVIDEISDDPVDALGYSWGGLLLEQAALDKPDRFNRLVLAATMPSWQCGIPSKAAIKGLGLADRSPDNLEKIAGDMYGGDICKNPELITALGLCREIDKPSYRRQKLAAKMCGYNFWRLPLLEQETLIMAGGDDPIAPLVNARVLRRLIPRSRLHIEDEGGHAFLLSRSVGSALVINQFLDKGRQKLLPRRKLALAA